MKMKINRGLNLIVFWTGQIARTKKKHRNGNRGFSLVELIIVIAIMAVLAAAIAPAMIRYINKARKADDIAAADSIASTFNAAINGDDDVYDYVNACVWWINHENRQGKGQLRIICFMSAGTLMTGWANNNFPNVANQTLNGYSSAQAAVGRAKIKKVLEELMGERIFKLKFTRKSYLDQWAICCDEHYQLYIFAAAGLNGYQYYINTKNTASSGTIHWSASNHGDRMQYELWPQADGAYHDLSTPPTRDVVNNILN